MILININKFFTAFTIGSDAVYTKIYQTMAARAKAGNAGKEGIGNEIGRAHV